jgi:hypothetical protein
MTAAWMLSLDLELINVVSHSDDIGMLQRVSVLPAPGRDM